MINNRVNRGGVESNGFDRLSVLLFLVIAIIGCVSVFSSSYDPTTEELFSFSHNYVKQAVWLGASLVVGMLVLLVDSSFIYKYSYILYVGGLLLLVLTLLFGREVNGAKAWFELGALRLQPVELVKITTALALARVMSENNFSISSLRGVASVGVVLLLPLMIIVLQNDTGSGIVFGALLFVLYREGLSRWIAIPPIIIAALFTLSLVVDPFPLTLSVLLFTAMLDGVMSGEYRPQITAFVVVMLGVLLLSLGLYLLFGVAMSLYSALVVCSLAMMVYQLFFAIRDSRLYRVGVISVALVAISFIPLTNYIFDEILRPHQQNRIMSFLGVVSDPLGSDYNVNQAKIAIGSGGLVGKGFLEGTQIRYGFVPERHTDFIFCSIAEEWGFFGVVMTLGCFLALILRLMWIGESNGSTFGRVYCYSVAAILLFHLFVNVGMTIGLFPVMGIPLPLVSYGGSSLLAFTIMISLAIRTRS